MPTLLAYIQGLAAALDDGMTFLVASGASTSVTVSPLANSTTGASGTRYGARWLAVVSGSGAGQQRQVKPNGYTPSTGILEITNPFGTNPATNDQVLLTGLFPVFEGLVHGEDTSYRQLINRGLENLAIKDRYTLSVTTGTTYTVPTWLDRASRLLGIWEPSPVSGRQPIRSDWRGWKLIEDGPAPYLDLRAPFASASGSVSLDVLRPAYTLINGADSASGLAAVSDTAVPTIDEVVTAALVEAYQALASRNTGYPSGDWRRRWIEQREIAHRLERYDRTREMVVAAPSEGRSVLPTPPEAA